MPIAFLFSTRCIHSLPILQVRDLGVTLDFSADIGNSCYQHHSLLTLIRINFCYSSVSKSHLVSSLVLSRFDNFNSTLSSLPHRLYEFLQPVLHAATWYLHCSSSPYKVASSFID